MIEVHFPIEKKFQGRDKIIFTIDNNKKPLKLETDYFYYFQGKNGVGKTTLLNIISLLTNFEGGTHLENNTIYLNRGDIDKTNHEKSRIRKDHFSYIFQDPHIINIYTIRENLKIVNPAFDFNFDTKIISQKINELNIDQAEKNYLQTKLSKIIHEKDNSPYYLSGGEKQLLSFIRAMIKPSNIMFADEPWASMDKLLKEFIEEQLYKYLENEDIFSEIRNRNNIQQINEKNMVIAIAHIFHHSRDISQYGKMDKNFHHNLNIEKITNGHVDKNNLELIRFHNKN